MIITAELAQQIVDSIMPLVQQNINIMDSTGVIVGSGQKNRLNTYHQGAMEVIRRGEVVEIFPEDVHRYSGVMPGLNWPIILGNQVVGVVGISGHPDLVRNTARLVKMVTELILERENLVEEFRANLQLREQFMQYLLSDRYQDNPVMKTAKLLRFKLDLPRLVAVVAVGPIIQDARNHYEAHELVTFRTRETLSQLLDNSQLIDARDLFIFLDDELIILKHFPENAGQDEFYKWGSEILTLLDGGHRYQGLRMGLGSCTSSPAELHASYKEAIFAKNHKLTNADITSIYDFDILVSYLVKQSGAIDSCLVLKKLREIILDQLDCKYDMRNTVNALLDNNMNISSAAKALFIHRNTLVFRLEKLKELTGLCPSQSLNHAILCRILFGS